MQVFFSFIGAILARVLHLFNLSSYGDVPKLTQMDLDFVDDKSSWRVRRERELAEAERETEARQWREYLEDRYGADTLCWLRWSIIPVWIALVYFAAVVIAAAVKLTIGWPK